jgi:hypothetical protein
MNLCLELLRSENQIKFACSHLAMLPELISCWSEVEGKDVEILSLMSKLVTLIPNLKMYPFYLTTVTAFLCWTGRLPCKRSPKIARFLKPFIDFYPFLSKISQDFGLYLNCWI